MTASTLILVAALAVPLAALIIAVSRHNARKAKRHRAWLALVAAEREGRHDASRAALDRLRELIEGKP